MAEANCWVKKDKAISKPGRKGGVRGLGVAQLVGWIGSFGQ